MGNRKGRGGTENVQKWAGGLAVAVKTGHGELRLKEQNLTLESNGGNKSETLMQCCEVKNKKNKNFEQAKVIGLGFRKNSEQGVGNCEEMVGNFDNKAQLLARGYGM